MGYKLDFVNYPHGHPLPTAGGTYTWNGGAGLASLTRTANAAPPVVRDMAPTAQDAPAAPAAPADKPAATPAKA